MKWYLTRLDSLTRNDLNGKQLTMKYLKYEIKTEYDLIKYEITFKIQKRLDAKWKLVQNEKSTQNNI